MSQTPAGWYPDPHDESQLRYWDGAQWTANQAPRTPQAPAPTPAAAPVAPSAGAPAPSAPGPGPSGGDGKQKNWFLRHKVLSAVIAVVAIVIVAAAASGGSGGDNNSNDAGGSNHSAKQKAKDKANDNSNSSMDSSDAANSGQNVEGSSAYGSSKMPLQNGDWRLDSVQLKNDGLGDFGGTARITYTGDDKTGGDNLFTITVFKGKKIVTTLDGAANSVKPGTTATVSLISTDKFVPGPYKYDFQNDL